MTSIRVRSRRFRAVLIPSLLVVAVLAISACGPTDSAKGRLAAKGQPCTVDLVGDSLSLGAHKYGGITEKFAAAGCELRNVDTVGGRRPEQGADVVERWAREQRLSSALVVVLGTNDCWNEAGMIRAMHRIHAAAGPDRPIVWVNSWRQGACDYVVNRVLENSLVEQHFARPDNGRMWIVDHWAWMAQNPGRAGDGIHLAPASYGEYADRIVRTFTTGQR
jgi:hypothetical protein